MVAKIQRARLLFTLLVLVSALVLLAPLSANAQVTVFHVKVTVANDQTATYCDTGLACGPTALSPWTIPGIGITLAPTQTLVLTQTGSTPVGATIGSNFDTSERIRPAGAGIIQIQDCLAATGKGCTTNIFIDTGGGLQLVYTNSSGNELTAFNLDTGADTFQEARQWSSPVFSAANYTLSLGYADNVHGPPQCTANCTPTPFNTGATAFLGAGLPPAGQCHTAPCWDAGALLITGKAVSLEGRMTGGGSVFTAGGVRVTHGFELHCNINDDPNNLEINWDGGNNFHLTSLTSVTCINNPAIEPPPPSAPFDTYIGKGVGTCNGLPASIEFTLTDAGEPGTKDTATYSITGGCTLTVSGNLDKGNQQAHNDN